MNTFWPRVRGQNHGAGQNTMTTFYKNTCFLRRGGQNGVLAKMGSRRPKYNNKNYRGMMIFATRGQNSDQYYKTTILATVAKMQQVQR